MHPRFEKKSLSKFYTGAKTIACSFALLLALTGATQMAIAGKDGAGRSNNLVDDDQHLDQPGAPKSRCQLAREAADKAGRMMTEDERAAADCPSQEASTGDIGG